MYIYLEVNECTCPVYEDEFVRENFTFYQVRINGKGFLHNQVNDIIFSYAADIALAKMYIICNCIITARPSSVAENATQNYDITPSYQELSFQLD